MAMANCSNRSGQTFHRLEPKHLDQDVEVDIHGTYQKVKFPRRHERDDMYVVVFLNERIMNAVGETLGVHQLQAVRKNYVRL